jgi:hypothetical protein
MNRMWVVIGLLAMVVGVVFFLQGIGVLGGSSMSGVSFWMWVGLILIIAGAVAVFRGARAGRRISSS